MIEEEWLRSTDPERMLRYLCGDMGLRTRWLLTLKGSRGEAIGPRASERKLRLYACACCHRVAGLFRDERSLAAVEAAERYAEGRIGEWERQAVEAAAREAVTKVLATPGLGKDPTGLLLRQPTDWTRAIHLATWAAAETIGVTPKKAVEAAVQAATAAAMYPEKAKWAAAALGAAARVALLREVFGNPFRPPAVDPAWLSWNDGTVRRLAEAIYAERRFADLPILADALEEAGCADAALLDHLRGPGPHVPGCWALDALLQKE